MSTLSRFSDAFVKVTFQEEPTHGDPIAEPWHQLGSQKHQGTVVAMTHTLQEKYPGYSIVATQDYRLNLLNFPMTAIEPLSPSDLVTNIVFVPLPKNRSEVPGALAQSIQYGGFKVSWQSYEFIVYTVVYPQGFGQYQQHFILHDGPKGPAHTMLLAAGVFADALHNEIWVFNQGFWDKDAGLWNEIQKASWDDVILEDDFKEAVKKDIYGFFDSEKLYKEYSLPWKRGIIFHGPPGNGKTITIKTIMKEADMLGYTPMYVKSFKSWMGDEGSMAAVFGKARQNSPCLIVLEDLDALINDSNRSFFLNELDGINGNDGILVIGTTNHFDRLDPGLSTRPSRFDRKYLYDDPNRAARRLYVKYWQDKLSHNKDLDFPESLANEVADTTERFSFAYLKEVFVSSLVTTLQQRQDGHDISFASCIRKEIETLRKQLDKPGSLRVQQASSSPRGEVSSPAPVEDLTALLRAVQLGATEDTVEPHGAWTKLSASFLWI
ncbi:unnamed protein product [Peniophora sp. CBMAI 1063]|nr:unnamed protein product [Peniophora sp. CBMAI 1063]